MYTLGAVLGQLPFAYLFTRLPMSWIIPSLDILWGVFTLLQFRVTSFGELAAYRFVVGWFEAAFFPGMHYVFGLFLFYIIYIMRDITQCVILFDQGDMEC